MAFSHELLEAIQKFRSCFRTVAALRSSHQCAVLNTEPQASARCWHDLRQDDAPVVVSAQAARLPEILQKAKQNRAAFVIIDTAPYSESAVLAVLNTVSKAVNDF